MEKKLSEEIKCLSTLPKKNEIVKDLTKLKEKLKLVYNLEPSERRNIPSIASDRTSFIKELISICKENPQLLNSFYNIEQLIKKFEMTCYFLDLSHEVQRLSVQLNDYGQMLGYETFKEAMLVKNHIKSTSNLNADYVDFVYRLNKYFPAYKKKANSKTPKIIKQKIALYPNIDNNLHGKAVNQ